MICKFQLPLSGNGPACILIYNEDKSFQDMAEPSEFLLDLFKEGEVKVFYDCLIGSGGVLMIQERAPWQDW